MRNVYILNTVAYNGTVVMVHLKDVFIDRELAQITMDTLNKMDEDDSNTIKTHRYIEEVKLFERYEDVKCLPEQKI